MNICFDIYLAFTFFILFLILGNVIVTLFIGGRFDSDLCDGEGYHVLGTTQWNRYDISRISERHSCPFR